MRGKDNAGILLSEKSDAQAAEQFLREYEIITEGGRSQRWTERREIRLRVHLLPFFGHLGISKVTPGKVQDYRIHRMTSRLEPNPYSRSNRPLRDKPPARSTLHNELVTLRQVLKTAIRQGWLQHLPDLSAPYRTQGKIVHRPWFSPAEYKQLYEATRAYARQPFHERDRWNAEQVHDYVLFLANTGLRPDEANNLQHRDVAIVEDDATGETILEIEVRGSRTCIHWATFDAQDNCSVEAMVARTVERLGGLDIVVNAAATPASVGGSAGVESVDTADLLADLDVKVLGYLRVARAAAPFMIANGWGRIINIGGLAVRSTGNYAGSIRNASVVALTKCLADELAEHGVSVTAVHPGATRAERTPARIAAKAALDGVTMQQAERLLYGHTLLGRIVEVKEVAALVAFLASPLSAAINGDNLFAGGGARKTIHY